MLNYKKPSRLIGIGLMCLFLTACSTRYVTKVEKVLPPDKYLEDCPSTDVPLRTTGDLPVALRASKADLKACNADKAALRLWAKGIK